MGKTKNTNQGFSLIELLIAITILSIIMIMVSQFMSTTSGAYRKTKKNMSVQTEAMQVLEQMSDTLMQAEYIRVTAMEDGKSYTITKNTTGKNERVVTALAESKIDYSFVPDNYGNYSKLGGYYTDNKVILDFDTYEIVDEKGNPYPLSGDVENGQKVRSFRALKDGANYKYIMPKYIYAEYTREGSAGLEETVHVAYYITPENSKTGARSIYMYRVVTSDSVNKQNFLYEQCTGKAYAAAGANGDGLLTDNLIDFYLSADAEGNAILTNLLFESSGYQYNAVETIKFRNSNVLTVRPQNLYRVAGTGVKTP